MLDKVKQAIIEELQEYTGTDKDFENLKGLDDLLEPYLTNAVLGNTAAETHIRLIKTDLTKYFQNVFPNEDVETYVSIASGPIRTAFKLLT
jgi:hypothetical protein